MQNQQTPSQQTKDWTDQTNLREAEKYKAEGNIFFANKQFKNALKKYHQAILHLAGIVDKQSPMAMYKKATSKQIAEQSNCLKFSIWLNMSQIYIYQEKFQKGLQTLKKAEELQSKGLPEETKKKSFSKLIYRKGICLMKMNYSAEARKQLLRLKQMDKSFLQECEQFQKQIKERQKISDQKVKKLYQGFFK